MAIIRDDEQLGGMAYPLLAGLDWHIRTTPIGGGGRKGLKKILHDIDGVVLRWVKDDHVNDLFVEGLTHTEQLQDKLGFRFSLKKGVFVWSKRVSRVMRPFFYWELFPEADVKLVYRPDWDAKQWDGAMLVDRAFLAKLCHHLPEAKRQRLLLDLKHTDRVELSILSGKGQDKGHAKVVDQLGCDIMLPEDTKTDVRFTDGKVFVGLWPVHHKQSMWLDVQSLVNHGEHFFTPEFLIDNLHQAGRQCLHEIESGVTEKRFENMVNAEAWPVAEYLACGGKAMWFSSVVMALARQHLKMVQSRGLIHLRAPIPGGRYYVFSDVVLGREIPKGHVYLDDTTSSAYISRHDWVEYSRILGGADQDDALWVYPFINSRGERTVMIWRSPNQMGEYLLLTPLGDISWATWPKHDETQLAPRIDQQQVEYLDLIEPAEIIDQPYAIGVCKNAIIQGYHNIGALGITVNIELVMKALTGSTRSTQPARLEDVIDQTVKLGGNLSKVTQYNREWARGYFLAHPNVPLVLQPRIIKLLKKDQQEFIQPTVNHWLDRFVGLLIAHTHDFIRDARQLASTAMPPLEVFQHGVGYDLEAIRVKQAYGSILRMALDTRLPEPEDFERARIASEKQIRQFPVSEWTRIAAAVATRTYIAGDKSWEQTERFSRTTSDAVLWQGGAKVDGKRQRGIVHLTLKMLREIGLIAELVETAEGVVKYYQTDAQALVPIELNGVWFSYVSRKYTYERQGDVPIGVRTQYKQAISKFAAEGLFNGQILVVGELNGRKVVYHNERLLAYIAKGFEDKVGATIVPQFALAIDGNLIVV